MTLPAIPTFLQPSVPGQMSNTLGTNTVADKIAIKARYVSPLATADGPSGARFTFTRLPAGAVNGLLASDTFWMGPGAITPPPVTIGAAMSTSAATYGGRLYLAGVDVPGGTPINPLLYSAPINGRSIGTWRQETLPAVGEVAGAPPGAMHSITIQNGFMYYWSYLGSGIIAPYYARINSDGTMGAWIRTSNLTVSYAINSGVLVGYTDTSGSYLTLIDLYGTVVPNGATLAADGSVSSWTGGTIFPGSQAHGAVLVVPSGNNDGLATMYVIGGDNGAGVVTAVITKSTLTKGVPGAWTTLGTGLPAARSYGGLAYINGIVYYVGGATTASSVGPTGAMSNAIYYIYASSLGGAWTTGGTLSTARAQLAAVGQAVGSALVGGTGGGPFLICIGGTTNGTTWGEITDVGALNSSTGAPGALTAAASGVLLQASDLGTGGAVVTNADGTVDVTFLYEALEATHPNAALANGDLVTVTAQFIDKNGGDPSPVASSVFKVGQAPTITAVVPANAATPNTGVPAISFAFNGGAGGSSERSYRIQLLNGAVTVFDSGLRYDSANSLTSAQVQALLTAGLLQSGVTYTLVITVVSTDGVDSPNTNTVTSTTTFTPNLAAAPALPTGFAVVPDNVNGLFSMSWTNPSGSSATLNRIYYRVSLANVWKVLKDNIAAVVGAAQTTQVMDQIGFLTSYDFAVSAMSATTESALSAVFTDGFETLAGSNSNLFLSTGTDAAEGAAVLTDWTQQQNGGTAWTKAANVVTPGNAAESFLTAGHVEWTDGQYTQRSSNPQNGTGIMVHVSGTNNNVTGYLFLCGGSGNMALFRRDAGGTFTGIATITSTYTAGTPIWLRIVCTGTSIQAYTAPDTAGAAGTFAAASASPAVDATYPNGQIALRSTGSGTFGGAFSGVCVFAGDTHGWSIASSSTACDPAVCLTKTNPYAGTYAVSIYNAAAGADCQLSKVLVNAAGTYTVAVQAKLAAGSTAGTGGTAISGLGYIAPPPADGAWHAQSESGAVGANVSVFLRYQGGTGTASFDNVTVVGGAGAYGTQIAPPLASFGGPGYTAMLHVAGNGPAQHAGIQLVGPVKIGWQIAVASTPRFGQALPLARYGKGYGRHVTINHTQLDPTLLEAVLTAARGGSTLCLRDKTGLLMYCAMDTSRSRSEELFGKKAFFDDTLTLTEVAYTYAA